MTWNQIVAKESINTLGLFSLRLLLLANTLVSSRICIKDLVLKFQGVKGLKFDHQLDLQQTRHRHLYSL